MMWYVVGFCRGCGRVVCSDQEYVGLSFSTYRHAVCIGKVAVVNPYIDNQRRMW